MIITGKHPNQESKTNVVLTLKVYSINKILATPC